MSTSKAGPHDYDAVEAGADLSAKLFYLAHMDTDGDLVLAGDGEPVYGAIVEAAAEGKAVTVQTAGVAKVILGATVQPGALCASDVNGKAVTATSGENTFGIFRTGGDANEIAEVLIDRGLVETA